MQEIATACGLAMTGMEGRESIKFITGWLSNLPGGGGAALQGTMIVNIAEKGKKAGDEISLKTQQSLGNYEFSQSGLTGLFKCVTIWLHF